MRRTCECAIAFTEWETGRARHVDVGELQHPTVRPAPSSTRDFVHNDVLPLRQICSVVEVLHPYAPVRIDDAQFVPAGSQPADLAAQIMTMSFEPPKHDGLLPRMCYGSCAVASFLKSSVARPDRASIRRASRSTASST